MKHIDLPVVAVGALICAISLGTMPASAADQANSPAGQAKIELSNGASISGRIAARTEQHITLEVVANGRVLSRRYPTDRIVAITENGTRIVLQSASERGGKKQAGSQAMTASGARSPGEINRLIDELGGSQPDWWDATPLNYPETLDLEWPQKPVGDWNSQKNVGQFLWDIIQPNPGKWKEGVRLVHFLLEKHQNDNEKRHRAMQTLGRLYFLLLRDYARAAFWWRQAGVEQDATQPEGVQLAECFWRLGNKDMALQFLQKNTTYFTTIKLLADMGETTRAITIAESAARYGWPDLAYLYAGDACRIDGRYDDASRFYKRVLDVKASEEREAKRVERNQQRARANIRAIQIYDNLQLSRIPDGTYKASSPGYAGDVAVEVTIQSGRIQAVRVTNHQEKQYYGALAETPAKIIEKQGVKGVDATTSATITSEAIINATALALTKGLP